MMFATQSVSGLNLSLFSFEGPRDASRAAPVAHHTCEALSSRPRSQVRSPRSLGRSRDESAGIVRPKSRCLACCHYSMVSLLLCLMRSSDAFVRISWFLGGAELRDIVMTRLLQLCGPLCQSYAITARRIWLQIRESRPNPDHDVRPSPAMAFDFYLANLPPRRQPAP